jgi:filamentous hemagglutinin family protein
MPCGKTALLIVSNAPIKPFIDLRLIFDVKNGHINGETSSEIADSNKCLELPTQRSLQRLPKSHGFRRAIFVYRLSICEPPIIAGQSRSLIEPKFMSSQLPPASPLRRLPITASRWTAAICGLWTLSLGQPLLAQSLLIDGSTPTLLNGGATCSGSCVITGGAQDGNGSGSNLFHSFERFDIDTGATVTFDDPGVNNIFSRVTGSTASQIDGRLAVNGAANLFLLNANGILFGNGASLDIQGSFLASSADRLLFENGNTFGISNSSLPSLLSVNVPVGLQFGSAPGAIQVQGSGHGLFYNPNDATVGRSPASSGLAVDSAQTLALLGGNLSLQGANLSAEGGRIELGSLGANSRVALETANSSGSAPWVFDYAGATSFQDITISGQSSLDASGDNGGTIQLQGRTIELSEGSAAIAHVLTTGGSNITLKATERIEVTGVNLSPTNAMQTGVYLEVSPGATGDGSSRLSVNTPALTLTAGAQIGNSMAGSGSAGTVDITADTVSLDNGSNATPSGLYAAVLPIFGPPPGADGQGGNLNITTNRLSVLNGALVSTESYGAGNAGNLTVNAADIEVIGANAFGPSAIASASRVPAIPPLPNGSGSGGNIFLTTARLAVAEGGQISVGTLSENSSGNIIINASERIELRGETANGRSGLFASALLGSGSGGNIEIATRQLSLLDGSTINASNFASTLSGAPPGNGSAGNIVIRADEVALKGGSLITTDTVAGDRANIDIQSDSLVLRQGSNINANATGTATGGNIRLDTEALIAFENSDITANAVDNFGGRVVINAETILGTAYREQLSTESDITASSALGPAFSGTVEIQTPQVDPTDGLTKLPESPSAENQIVAACERINSNAFVATGRGGLPEGASQLLTGQSIWNDFRLIEGDANASIPSSATVISSESADRPEPSNIASAAAPSNNATVEALVEAQSWSLDRNGQVVLGTTAAAALPPATSECLAS